MAAIPDCVFFFPFGVAGLVYERREWEGSAVIVGRLNGLYSDALWTASAFEGSGLGGWGCFDREEIVGWVGELALR